VRRHALVRELHDEHSSRLLIGHGGLPPFPRAAVTARTPIGRRTGSGVEGVGPCLRRRRRAPGGRDGPGRGLPRRTGLAVATLRPPATLAVAPTWLRRS